MFLLPNRTIRLMLFVLGVIALGVACRKHSTDPSDEDDYIPMPPADSAATKILFIGNSLTYYNDQPEIFRELAEAEGKNVFVDASTGPGYQLVDHVNSKNTSRKIQEQAWDFVILQEAIFEIAFPEEHKNVLPTINTMQTRILSNKADTKLLYALPWALEEGIYYYVLYFTYDEAQRMLRDGAVALADSLDIGVAPVGWAWRSVIHEHPDLDLFDSDRSHPSYLGSYLGACVYYAAIFQESPESNPFVGEAGATAAGLLQHAAAQTVLDSLGMWRIPPFLE